MLPLWLTGLAFAQALPDGLQLAPAYTGELWGSSRGGVAHAGNLDLTAFADLDLLLGVPGSSVYVHGVANHSTPPSTLLGDAQWTSNIEAWNSVALYEGWVQQRVKGVSLRLGVIELNSEFDTNDAALVFIHSSQGMGAELGLSGVNGPSSFPNTGLTARLRAGHDRSWVQVAVSDGVPAGRARNDFAVAGDGMLGLAEVGTGSGAAELTAGGWAYTTGGGGGYGMVELDHRPRLRGPALLASARSGAADPRFQRFPFYVGGSLALRGLLQPLPDDTVGVAVCVAMTGEPARDDGALPAEIAVELTWRLHLTMWMYIQPDLQLVLSPDADPSKPSGVLGAVRFFVTTPARGG